MTRLLLHAHSVIFEISFIYIGSRNNNRVEPVLILEYSQASALYLRLSHIVVCISSCLNIL